VTASVGEQQGLTLHQFDDHAVKINEACYRNVMLLQQLLLAIRKILILKEVFHLSAEHCHGAHCDIGSQLLPVTSKNSFTAD